MNRFSDNQLQLSLFGDQHFFSNKVTRANNPIIWSNLENINRTLPELYEDQQVDVLKAEIRFFENSGKGILFTNGTGTGKTYTGLGIAKRFWLKGMKNILLVVPTDTKAKDWIKEAKSLDLVITQLEDIKSKGKDIVITTYANFYQNESLLSREFSLIIYDECHYLNQNESGTDTVYFEAHKKLANLPSTARIKAIESLPPKPVCPEYPDSVTYSVTNYLERKNAFDKAIEKYYSDKEAYQRKLELWNKHYNEKVQEYIDKTKVVFLSASPFAYHKSCIIGDGTLWDINETREETCDSNKGYNEPVGMEKFLTTHFGYRMRYNKANKPESGVDVNLLERMFYENMVEKGVITGRALMVPQDYSRQFVLLASELGAKINEGMKLFYSFNKEFQDKYSYLSSRVSRKWSYLYTCQLLEGLKGVSVIGRIQEHLNLGRKVVVFHGFNNALPSHPFHFSLDNLLNAEDWNNSHVVQAVRNEISLFELEYPHLVNLEIESVLNVRLALNRAFSKISREFNGTIPKKRRNQYLQEFNLKGSGIDLFIIQRKAGKEGISLHDTIGDCQRVLIDLGLPTAPTDAIQTEGRIYRLGVKSNSVIEYPVLHTDFERIAFADKVASRTRTAENLAMGKKARNLETAFIEGYLNATSEGPSLLQGVGGLEADRNNISKEITDFERAKSFYFARGKKTSRNKSKEGIDYFATPEPLGLKMVEWLGLQANDDALEPSAGHGAIGRFFEAHTNNTFIEPSYSLASELAINVKGEVKQIRFEGFHIINKYDGIAMNPPFGTAGKTAMEHIEKAFRHLRENGRIVAIVPNGPSMDKRLNHFFYGEDEKGRFLNPAAHLIAEFILPGVTFSRAGTSVNTKVIIIDKIYEDEKVAMKRTVDFSAYEDINNFFDAIEHVDVNQRNVNSEHVASMAS